MSSLLTSAAGLNTLQTGLDVISNNISNVNTTGYRGVQTQFADMFYNATQTANKTIPVNTQVGSGSKIIATPTVFQQGALQQTSVSSDVAISGGGFFATSSTASGTPTNFTRAGNFITDGSGYLRTQSGQFVQGVGNFGAVGGVKSVVAPTGVIGNTTAVQIPQTLANGELVTGYSIGQDGAISVKGNSGTNVVVGYLALANFTNNNGLTQSVGSNFTATVASGLPTFYAPGQGVVGSTQGGALENSNVDLATQLTNMITTQQAFDACAKGVTVSDQVLQTAIGLFRA